MVGFREYNEMEWSVMKWNRMEWNKFSILLFGYFRNERNKICIPSLTSQIGGEQN
jgi:hypothetical protein